MTFSAHVNKPEFENLCFPRVLVNTLLTEISCKVKLGKKIAVAQILKPGEQVGGGKFFRTEKFETISHAAL